MGNLATDPLVVKMSENIISRKDFKLNLVEGPDKGGVCMMQGYI